MHQSPYLTKAERLVVQGQKVMLTLAEAQAKSRNRCHIDWVSLIVREPDILASEFYQASVDGAPHGGDQSLYIMRLLAKKLCQLTGYEMGELVTPGFNFYRSSIVLLNDQGKRIGFVSGGGERQNDTYNLVLRGEGCTFAQPGWQEHLHGFAANLNGYLARIDLALDFFEGQSGGVEAVRQAYRDGAFDYNGRRPSHDMSGAWDGEDGHKRTFYVGQKGSKCICAYEKGHKYGMADSKWWRYEQRFGNQDRILPLDMLTEPDKYFAGAYPFNTELLDEAEPVTIKTKTELQDMTAEAVVERKLAWLENTVAPTIVHLTRAFDEGAHGFMWLCDLAVKHAYRELPRSLQGIPSNFLKKSIQRLLTPSPLDSLTPPVPAGLVAT